MTPASPVKAAFMWRRPHAVAVIFSRSDLQRALRLRQPPDFFEIRLDGLIALLDELPTLLLKLKAPLIITARSPEEGGANHLSLGERRRLLGRFLPSASLVDVELSSVRGLADICAEARAKKIPVLLSWHDLQTTPPLHEMMAAARRAHSLGAAVFKIAARTDRAAQIEQLRDFVKSEAAPLPISAMGLGRLGIASRRHLLRAGSVLNYAHLGRAVTPGQWSLAQLRAALREEKARRRPPRVS